MRTPRTLAAIYALGRWRGRRVIAWRLTAEERITTIVVAVVMAFAVGFAMLGLERVFIGGCS